VSESWPPSNTTPRLQSRAIPPPFGRIDLSEYWSLRSSKDYKFLDLCLDWESPPERRRPLLGLPPDASSQVLESLADAEMPHWLTFDDIQKAWDFKNFGYADLGFSAQVVLEMMRFLATELGGDRVRLIIGVD
jgi:hypothetical protein